MIFSWRFLIVSQPYADKFSKYFKFETSLDLIYFGCDILIKSSWKYDNITLSSIVNLSFGSFNITNFEPMPIEKIREASSL